MDLDEKTFEEEQFLVPARQVRSKKASLACGTLHAAEAVDKAWLCSWYTVAPRRMDPPGVGTENPSVPSWGNGGCR